jgi:hypothetical protein
VVHCVATIQSTGLVGNHQCFCTFFVVVLWSVSLSGIMYFTLMNELKLRTATRALVPRIHVRYRPLYSLLAPYCIPERIHYRAYSPVKMSCQAARRVRRASTSCVGSKTSLLGIIVSEPKAIASFTPNLQPLKLLMRSPAGWSVGLEQLDTLQSAIERYHPLPE